MDNYKQLLNTIEDLIGQIQLDHTKMVEELSQKTKEHQSAAAAAAAFEVEKAQVAKMKVEIDEKLAIIEKEKMLDAKRKELLDKKENDMQERARQLQNILSQRA